MSRRIDGFILGALAMFIAATVALICYASVTHGRAPSVNEAEWSGFTPSDAPPQSLPVGTVTYEIYDSAAHMRYWVFRWPDTKQYSVVPRLTCEGGQLVPYEPPDVVVGDE